MARNLQARRKLSELYRKGIEVRFGPDGYRIGRQADTGLPPFDDPLREDEVAVWVCPPSPLQRDQAMRDAQAAKARALIKAKRDENSEEHLTTLAFLAEMSHETLIDYVLEGERDEREREAMRDVLGEDEWKDITELQDALRQFDESGAAEDDPEWVPVLERDREYGRQVNKRLREITEGARESYRMLSIESLEKRALDKRSELVGAQRFMTEFELRMTYYSVRDIKDRNVLFFDSPHEFSEQDDIIQHGIKEALAIFINDGTEAKNWSGAASGSSASTPPDKPETSAASTPAAVSA